MKVLICRPFNSKGALEKAKYAVESQYAVVGVLEDFNTTLTVLEKYIPRFFNGASQMYHSKFYYFREPQSKQEADLI